MSTILVVDDEPALRFTLQAVLEDSGYTVLQASHGREALAQLQQHPEIALVVSDLKMPVMDGMALLAALAGQPDAPRMIMTTAHGSERDAVLAMKQGALDYLPKPFEAAELVRIVQRGLATSALGRENRLLKARSVLGRSMVFDSPAMDAVAQLVSRVADKDISVLITGESGVGKELVAEALVAGSRRASAPYVRFHCGGVRGELMASELFGHDRGAFTGAQTRRAGLFRRADRGTLLLDEVGELDADSQVALLRVLQDGHLKPVGSDLDTRVDVRILAATHRDLEHTPGFRQDLFFRLNVVHIHVPPLRERRSDIPPLVRHFARRAAERFGLEPVSFSDDAIERLTHSPWPGNVRQLQHSVERLVATEAGPVIRSAAVERSARGAGGPTADPMAGATRPAAAGLAGAGGAGVAGGAGAGGGGGAGAGLAGGSLRAQLQALEERLLREAVATHGGNQSAAARSLGVSRTTLISKLKKFGLLP